MTKLSWKWKINVRKSESKHIGERLIRPPNRNYGWIEIITLNLERFFHLRNRNQQISSLIVGLFFGMLFLGVLVILGFFQGYSNIIVLLREYPGTDLAIVGISAVFVVYEPIVEGTWNALNDDDIKDAFGGSVDYLKTVRQIFDIALNNFFSIVGSTIWILFIVWRVAVHFPYPVPGFSVYPYVNHFYTPLDWYSLFLFFISMAILGTGSWNLLGGGITFLKTKLYLHPSEMYRLKKLDKYFIQILVGWYFFTLVSAPVLIILSPSYDIFVPERFADLNPITLVQVVVGLILFLAPNYQLHRFAEAEKQRVLISLTEIRRSHAKKRRRFEKALFDGESEEVIKELGGEAKLFNDLINMVENESTWLFNIPSLTLYILSTLFTILVTSVITHAFG